MGGTRFLRPTMPDGRNGIIRNIDSRVRQPRSGFSPDIECAALAATPISSLRTQDASSEAARCHCHRIRRARFTPLEISPTWLRACG